MDVKGEVLLQLFNKSKLSSVPSKILTTAKMPK